MNNKVINYFVFLAVIHFFILFSTILFAKEIAIEAPETVVMGGDISVTWSGKTAGQHYITIVKPDATASSYTHYQYTRSGNPLVIHAPMEPGTFELRYNDEDTGTVLARRLIEVQPASYSVEAAKTGQAGAKIDVTWTGPNNQGDYITVVEKGAKPGAYTHYVMTSHGSPVSLQLPDVGGEYEIRYQSERADKILATTPLTILENTATLSAPTSALAGSTIGINWTGPNNRNDYITIVKKGAADRTYNQYVMTNRGNPLQLKMPDEAGDYELRYANGLSDTTVAAVDIHIKAATAEITKAPEKIKAREIFKVSWIGPNNEGDYITIVKSNAKEGVWDIYTYTSRGNPLTLAAPEEPGQYELRYATGQTYKTLAKKNIQVVEGDSYGTVKVNAPVEWMKRQNQQKNVALVLDASGSMLKKLDGKRRIDVAKQAILSLINNSLTEQDQFMLRVFGHKEANSCRTDLEIPLQPLDKKHAKSVINNINAINLAKTPIADSLAKVVDDLGDSKNPLSIILLTDGEETCGGDPKAAIQRLKSGGYRVQVNIVGFAIDEWALKQMFLEWAHVGNGNYFNAKNSEELTKQIIAANEVIFHLKNQRDEIVASGTVNGAPVAVKSGSYQLYLYSSINKPILVVVKDKQNSLIKLR